jgi:hypothetical protein
MICLIACIKYVERLVKVFLCDDVSFSRKNSELTFALRFRIALFFDDMMKIFVAFILIGDCDEIWIILEGICRYSTGYGKEVVCNIVIFKYSMVAPHVNLAQQTITTQSMMPPHHFEDTEDVISSMAFPVLRFLVLDHRVHTDVFDCQL